MWFNQYPYINLTDLNLDFIYKSIKELRYQLENFININTIKYANPIQWNITTQYEANTVVIDANDGTAYLSVKPVPSGVAITNTDYWTPIFTLNLLSANQNITFRDDGSNVLATFSSVEGDWIIWNNSLYRVSQTINVNEAYVVGYNLDRYSVELFIKDYLTEVLTIIGDLDDLNTTDKDSIVDAINECLQTINNDVSAINLTIGDLNDLTTSDKDSVVDAINSVMGDVVGGLVFSTPEQFGAIGDGVADDTEAVQAAIDEAITEHKKLVLTKTYLVNTLFINSTIDISGGGTLKGQPLRYDTTLSTISNANRFFETNHPEYYHKNTILTVHVGSSPYQVYVVDHVEDNKIYIERHFYETSTSDIDTFNAGADVNIHTTILEIAATNTNLASDTIISGISIHDINMNGSQLGYDNSKHIVFDGRYNGLIYAHSIKNSEFSNITGGNCISTAFGFLGTCSYIHVTNNTIKNVHSAFESALETECGITFHWSQRFIGAQYTPSDCVVSNNIVDDCYDGIFLSACVRFNISNNIVTNIIYRGLMLYQGDNAYSSRNHVVDGNTFRNCAQSSNNIAVIYVSGTIQSVISNNNILLCTNGITIGKGDDIDIIGNQIIGVTHSCITDYNGYRHNINCNYLFASTGTIAHIVINKQDSGNSYIVIKGNTYEGATSSNAAIKLDNGQNIKIVDDVLHASPAYLTKPDTNNITLGSVLIMNCYVNGGVALAAELAVLKYRDCVNSSNAIVNNVT